MELSRRQWIELLASTAVLPLVGCGGTTSSLDAANNPSCPRTPLETAGPFPGDGSFGGANALALAGIVRSDIRSSFDGPTAVAPGVALTLAFTVTDSSSCEPLAGRAVYVWQNDRDGNYSMYAPAIFSENYLRGVQVTDPDGRVTFNTIFPGCYGARWPHIHFSIYASAAAAMSGNPALVTSQLALPPAPCEAVYASADYGQSGSRFRQRTLASDSEFGDDAAVHQLAEVTGSIADGFVASLAVVISA
jgi:protocatechuate 3,4-dioxygenase beta subunit